MRIKTILKIMPLLLLMGLLQLSVVNAGTRNGIRWTAGCDGFTSQGGGILLDRNNTGNGTESFTISAVDGNGNTVFGPVTDSSLVGSRLSIPQGAFFGYTTAPTANPILVTLTSNAGNGYSQQTIYSTLGLCDRLPTVILTAIGLDVLETAGAFVVVDGRTSPSVPLNVDPPRPNNPDGIGVFVNGYLVVNTASLNIRSGDSPAYTIVGRVAGGTQMLVLGRNADRSWWFVQVGEIRGWVNGSLTVVRGDLTQAPIAPVVGEILGARLYVYSNTYLLQAPVANSSWLCEIRGNAEYHIVGQNSNGEFIQVQADCNGIDVIGWVPAEYGAIRNAGDLGIPVTAR